MNLRGSLFHFFLLVVVSSFLIAKDDARASAFLITQQQPAATLSATEFRLCGHHYDDNNMDIPHPGDTRRNFVNGCLRLVTAIGLTVKPMPSHAQQVPVQQPILYNTAKDIPDSIIDAQNQWLYGYVVKVIDGDTLRIRHVPNIEAFTGEQQRNSKVKVPTRANMTISVRIYGIDAPETAKKETELSQPFGEEAKQFTKDLVYHKLVAVKLLRRDKYNRIIGEVETCISDTTIDNNGNNICKPKDVSVELVSRGLATMYTGGGAEYNGKKTLLKQNVEAAQRSKVGIWSLGDDLVTPAEFKRMKK